MVSRFGVRRSTVSNHPPHHPTPAVSPPLFTLSKGRGGTCPELAEGFRRLRRKSVRGPRVYQAAGPRRHPGVPSRDPVLRATRTHQLLPLRGEPSGCTHPSESCVGAASVTRPSSAHPPALTRSWRAGSESVGDQCRTTPTRHPTRLPGRFFVGAASLTRPSSAQPPSATPKLSVAAPLFRRGGV